MSIIMSLLLGGIGEGRRKRRRIEATRTAVMIVHIGGEDEIDVWLIKELERIDVLAKKMKKSSRTPS